MPCDLAQRQHFAKLPHVAPKSLAAALKRVNKLVGFRFYAAILALHQALLKMQKAAPLKHIQMADNTLRSRMNRFAATATARTNRPRRAPSEVNMNLFIREFQNAIKKNSSISKSRVISESGILLPSVVVVVRFHRMDKMPIYFKYLLMHYRANPRLPVN